MSEPYIGEIRLVGFNFPPRGWATCEGQLLPINNNQTLFSILGTIYGGDGRTTFALPDLRGRAPLHFGQGAGLSNRTLGSKGGEESVVLQEQHLPGHSHAVMGTHVNATADHVEGAMPAVSEAASYGGTGSAQMAASVLKPKSGGGQAHENMQPFIALYFVIALVGIFPSRN